MALAYLYPSADVNVNWLPSAGTRWEAVKSSGGAHITPNTAAATRYYAELDNLPASAGWVTGALTWYGDLKYVAPMDGNVESWVHTTSGDIQGDMWGSGTMGLAYQWHSTAFNCSDQKAAGGTAWTITTVNSAQIGIWADMDVGQDNNAFCDSLYATITYHVAGGLVFALGSLLPPIIGALGTLSAREWTSLRRALGGRRWLRPGMCSLTFRAQEWERLRREALAYRYPVSVG